MRDSYRHKGMRKKMVEKLKVKGLSDERVIQAMMNVPRHLFVDNAFTEHAYEDKAFPIAAGQTISHPSTVAMQSQLLNLDPDMKVLEIGTGSGYQAAVLEAMRARLVSIERQRLLYNKTKPLLLSMGSKARLFYGDGYKGKAAYGPYDRILVTCGAPFVPKPLIDQLRPGGILVIPVGVGEVQKMHKFQKTLSGSIEEEVHGNYSFVPMLADKQESV